MKMGQTQLALLDEPDRTEDLEGRPTEEEGHPEEGPPPEWLPESYYDAALWEST